MATINVNPVALIAGTIGAPIAFGAIGRSFITTKEKIATEAEADSELRRLLRNLAIYNGVVALGLGYAGSRKGISEGWRSAAIGGAIGTGLIAALLGASLVTGPAKVEPKAEETPPPGGVFGAYPRAGGALPAARSAPLQQTWTSAFMGHPR